MAWQALFAGSAAAWLVMLAPLYLFAVLRGDKSAKAIAHLLAINGLLHASLATINANPAGGVLGLDSLLLAGVVVVALRSLHIYPLVIAATQLLIVCAEGLAAAGLIERPVTLIWLVAVPSAVQVAAFAFGLIVHRRSPRPGFKVRKPA